MLLVDTAAFLDRFHRYRRYGIASDDYHLSDDDRGFWWQPEGDVCFTAEAWLWMKRLRDEWQRILETAEPMSAGDAQRLWVDTLHDADETYYRTYCFRDTFYEFLVRAAEPEVQAAVLLFKQLVDCNRDEMTKGKMREYWPELMLLDEPVRRTIKRYLAVLGNPKLREKTFGF